MKFKNVSARAYGVAGKIIAPLQVFEVTDEVTLASIRMHIDSGDFETIVTEDAEKRKPGRPAKAEKDAD
jgi:hypothetical protein